MTDVPVFMSPQHVARMNEILAGDAISRAECAALDRAYWMVYELTNTDQTVWWSVEFNPAHGVRFGLQAPGVETADILYRGDYRQVVQATQRIKQGSREDMPVTTQAAPDALAKIQAAFAAAAAVATIPTEFPEF